MDSRAFRTSAKIAVAFGVFLVFAETRRNWGAWGHPLTYLLDYLMAVCLMAFGFLGLRGKRWARGAIIASWALTILLFTFSFVGHLRRIDQPTYGPVPQVRLTIWIGALDAIAVLGLGLAVASLRPRRPGT